MSSHGAFPLPVSSRFLQLLAALAVLLCLSRLPARAESRLRIEVDTDQRTYRIVAVIDGDPIRYDESCLDENRGGRVLIRNAKGETLPIFDPAGYSEYGRNQMVRNSIEGPPEPAPRPRTVTVSGPVTGWRPVLDLMLTIKEATSVPAADWKQIKITYRLSGSPWPPDPGSRPVEAESDWFSLKQEVLEAIPSYR